MKKARINRGDVFGQWTIAKKLNRGGNAAVYRAKNQSGEKVAIKFLDVFRRDPQATRYQRFKDEIKVIRENTGIGGILPIIDFNLPEDLKDEYAWYSMPLATPLLDFLKGKYTEDKVRVILQIAKILSPLHASGISHRDIKPTNILVLDDSFFLADFGLADYPEKTDLTREGESVGARWTIAPEMQRESTLAEGKAADIYSLAKTLWILITGKEKGFEGQYNPESVNALHNFDLPAEPEATYYEPKSISFTIILDDLIKKSTDDNPDARPSINDFIKDIECWLETFKSFQLHNPLEWQGIHEKLFPFAVPNKTVWQDREAIVKVLSFVGGIKDSNYMLLPSVGGTDLTSANIGHEVGAIELNRSPDSVYIVKPKRLILNSPSNDFGWSYFLLETDGLEPIGLERPAYSNKECFFAEVVDVGEAEYIDLECWCTNEYKGEPLPEGARRVVRYLNGNFLIVQKTSVYNKMSSTDDARHAKVSIGEFEKYMQHLAGIAKEIMEDSEFQRSFSTNLADKDSDERTRIIGERIANFIEKKLQTPRIDL